MKKVVSVLLAVVMLFTMSVIAFATDVTEAGTYEDAIVKTSTKDKDGNDAASFTVTYPAETVIAWNDTDAYNVEYSVKSQLAFSDRINVTVAGKNNVMSAAEAGNTATLAYTLDGTVDATTASAVANESFTATVTVAEDQWAVAPVGEYSDNLTFTVAVVPAK